MPTLRSGGIGPSITSEGALLPADLLGRIAGGDNSIGGLRPVDDYHLPIGVTFGEATTAAWNRVVKAWASTAESRSAKPVGSAESSRLRERWLLPLFEALGYGRLPANRASLEVEGRSYPVSHLWEGFPLHLVGWSVELDRRSPGVSGAAKQSPYSLVQELLNRSPNHLWGIVTNGRTLRLLRDSVSLTRQAFVEFDLERMMEGELYADFVVLWLLCHPSRVEGANPTEFWLERWMRSGIEEGTRALEGLRAGVEKAIQGLGSGFLAHAGNRGLRESLSSGELSAAGYYREVLRLVYQLIFLFTCEDRGVLLAPNASEEAQGRYSNFYSSRHLRSVAGRVRGSSRHQDLWHGLRIVIDGLSREGGIPELGLSALGSLLFSADSTPHLRSTTLANEPLLEAIRNLATIQDRGFLRSVDYRHLGAEELGGVYEALLELHPEVDIGAGQFRLIAMTGNERKTSGSYYTPTSLTNCLLDSALEPTLEKARRAQDPEAALLELKVLDPACGSGHFLVAAAQRIAAALAAVRSGQHEPGPAERRLALRDVIGRCIYGVDMNPMAAEICKIGLWLETVSAGLPLSFLDHHIRSGNALIGATPALVSRGIPDQAYEPIEGDDRVIARNLKKRNREERAGQLVLGEEPLLADWSGVLDEAAVVRSAADGTMQQVAAKAARYEALHQAGSPWARRKQVADAWCAAFVAARHADSEPITERALRDIGSDRASESTLRVVETLADEYQFFHWDIEFPDAFRPNPAPAPDDAVGWIGGFDLVVGNPPWERLKLQEQEFFAARNPAIATAKTSALRTRLIQALAADDPTLHQRFRSALRRSEGESHFLRDSGRYPLTGRGDINTYAVFAETMRTLTRPGGRAGLVTPLGIATDSTARFFFADLVERGSLVSLYGFENEEFIFPGIDHRVTFCLLTLGDGDSGSRSADFVFYARNTGELADPQRHVSLTSADFSLLNPNTKTCPLFRSRQDAELTKAVHRRVPVLVDESKGPEGNAWGISYLRMLDMANDSALFHSQTELEAEGWELKGSVFLRDGAISRPLYEAKMVHQFDHRFGTYSGQTPAQAKQGKLPELDDAQHANAEFVALPRYWVQSEEVDKRLGSRWTRDWLLGWREISFGKNERTVIAAVIPRAAVGHTMWLGFPETPAVAIAGLLANLNSLALDYLARQKIGGTHLSLFIFNQLPVLPPQMYAEAAPWSRRESLGDWIASRVLELTYTATDLGSFGRDLGWTGPPFRWDDTRRLLLRDELDAAYLHLYQLSRVESEHLLDSFAALRRSEVSKYGRYRTRLGVLDLFDALDHAAVTGIGYESPLVRSS